MNATRPVRPIPLFLTALVAFFSALAALAVSNGAAHAHGNDAHHGGTAGSILDGSFLALINEQTPKVVVHTG